MSTGSPTRANLSPPKGAIDRSVTQLNIASTICVSGYTTDVRPSSSYTNSLKLTQMRQRHLKGDPSAYEEDHLVPLELGGSPTSPDNLWPQPRSGSQTASQKDHLENQLHREVCAGTMLLSMAQRCIQRDWVTCWVKEGRP